MENNSENITFIIPNRGGGASMQYAINKHKELFPNSKIIVVSQEDNIPFMRGQLFNIGHNFCETDYMCLIDNDMFLPQYIDLISIYTNMGVNAFQPFSIIDQVTILPDQSYRKTSEWNIYMTDAKGGACFISKEKFEEANGFSNLFINWGAEDDEFDKRADLKYIVGQHICHITHPRRQNDAQKNTILNREFYYSREQRDYKLDGFNDTVYDIVYDKIEDGVRYIGVNNIRTNEDFQYKNLIDKHYL